MNCESTDDGLTAKLGVVIERAIRQRSHSSEIQDIAHAVGMRV